MGGKQILEAFCKLQSILHLTLNLRDHSTLEYINLSQSFWLVPSAPSSECHLMTECLFCQSLLRTLELFLVFRC